MSANDPSVYMTCACFKPDLVWLSVDARKRTASVAFRSSTRSKRRVLKAKMVKALMARRLILTRRLLIAVRLLISKNLPVAVTLRMSQRRHSLRIALQL